MRTRLVFNLAISASLLIFLSCSSGGSSNKPAAAAPNAPELTDVDPEVNDPSALLGAVIITTFDQNMEPAAVDTFVVYGTQTGKLTGAYAGGGTDTLSFDPDFGFKIGEEIEIILTDSLSSTGGLFLDAPVVYRFRAETRPGSGNFTTGDSVGSQTNTSGLASGDWDGDGDLDLASANFGASTVSVLENQP